MLVWKRKPILRFMYHQERGWCLPVLTHSFPKLLDALAAPKLGYLEQHIGVYSGLRWKSKHTTIRAGTALIALIEKHKVTLEDYKLDDDEEVIILKRPKANGYDDQGGFEEYEDTPATRRMRDEVFALNSWLERSDIRFDPKVYPTIVDVRARRLFRYFANGRFDNGGRLFRGFWENLPKLVRLQGITIEGERVVELDYGQLNPTLAYYVAEAAPPPGDAYTLPGLAPYRDGVKRIFNAMLFDERPRKRFPEGEKKRFPPKTKIGDVTGAIHDRHPRLASVLSTGVGFQLMFLESEIMMRVLERCRLKGIVALPVFDALIVKVSAAREAKAVMIEQFKKKTGLEIEVKLEQLEAS